MKIFKASNGTPWAVQVRMPSHSSAMVVFLHPTGETARLNRYAWVNSRGVKSLDPRARLTEREVLDTLDEVALSRLFRRSMPIEASRPTYIAS